MEAVFDDPNLTECSLHSMEAELHDALFSNLNSEEFADFLHTSPALLSPLDMHCRETCAAPPTSYNPSVPLAELSYVEVLNMMNMEPYENSASEVSILKPKQRLRPGRRMPRACPIPSCKGKIVKNLWNHLFQTHKHSGQYTGMFVLQTPCHYKIMFVPHSAGIAGVLERRKT